MLGYQTSPNGVEVVAESSVACFRHCCIRSSIAALNLLEGDRLVLINRIDQPDIIRKMYLLLFP